MTSVSALDSTQLDRAVADLRAGAEQWTATPIAERISLLERMLPRIAARAAGMVADAAVAKDFDSDSPWAAEDWIGAPWALAQG